MVGVTLKVSLVIWKGKQMRRLKDTPRFLKRDTRSWMVSTLSHLLWKVCGSINLLAGSALWLIQGPRVKLEWYVLYTFLGGQAMPNNVKQVTHALIKWGWPRTGQASDSPVEVYHRCHHPMHMNLLVCTSKTQLSCTLVQDHPIPSTCDTNSENKPRVCPCVSELYTTEKIMWKLPPF